MIVKCPLKIILLGEHSVLYHKRAVTMAVDLYLTLSIKEQNSIEIIYNKQQLYTGDRFIGSPTLDIDFDNVDVKDNQVLSGILHVLKTLCIGCTIEIKSDVPLGCGLGTSAAASISIALGCLSIANNFHSLNVSENDLKKQSYLIADKLDYFIHGKGSGIDVLTCFYGGIQYYDGILNTNGSIANFCTKLSIELPKIHVLYSKIQKDTLKMVSKVSQQYKLYPKVILSIMSTIDELITCFINGESIQHLSNYCHDMLVSLGVSHPKLEEAVRLLRQNGISSKLTGAGNGGCLITFGELNESILQQIRALDYDIYPIKCCESGVQIE